MFRFSTSIKVSSLAFLFLWSLEAGAKGANWVQLANCDSLDRLSCSIDQGFKKTSSSFPTLYIMENYRKVRTEANKRNYLSSKKLYQVDCQSKSSRVLFRIDFRENDGLGMVTDSVTQPSNWQPLLKTGLDQHMLSIACH